MLVILLPLLFLIIHWVGLARCRCTRRPGIFSGLIVVWLIFFFFPFVVFVTLGRQLADSLAAWLPDPLPGTLGLLVAIGVPGCVTASLVWLEMRSALVFRWLLVGVLGCLLRIVIHGEQGAFLGGLFHGRISVATFFVVPTFVLGSFIVGIIHEVLAHPWQKFVRNECEHCGYSLEGLLSGTCPECGHASNDKA